MKKLVVLALLSSCCGGNISRFPEGTRVQHKTGGPEMIVVDHFGCRTQCRYFNTQTGEYEHEEFYEAELEQVKR